MIKRITLTEDHMKLINLIKFEEDEKKHPGVIFVDKVNPYILSGRLEDIAFALGLSNMKIPGTEESAEGAAFPDDTEQYMLSVHHYIVDNILDIENIIHQTCFRGGITPGTYKCVVGDDLWEKED